MVAESPLNTVAAPYFPNGAGARKTISTIPKESAQQASEGRRLVSHVINNYG